MTWSTFVFWGVLALIAFLLYRARAEWRRSGRTRQVEVLLLLSLMLVGIPLRGAPDVVLYTYSAVLVVVALSRVWRDRKTFFKPDLMTWLLGAAIVQIVILEIDHDFYRFLSRGGQRALMGLFGVTTVVLLCIPIVQLTRLTIEARRVIAEARALLKTAAAAERRRES